MDIFYYSKVCPHSQKVIQFITKNNLVNQLSCINVDKRKRDHNQNQLIVQLENGQMVQLPPNLHSIPAVLCPKRNYELLSGVDNILKYLQERYQTNLANAVSFGDNRIQTREPIGTPLGSFNNNSNIYSEQFTPYGLDPETLSTRTTNKRELYNYVSVDHSLSINTPEETWKSERLPSNVTIERSSSGGNRTPTGIITSVRSTGYAAASITTVRSNNEYFVKLSIKDDV
jgi:hypothetical protein